MSRLLRLWVGEKGGEEAASGSGWEGGNEAYSRGRSGGGQRDVKRLQPAVDSCSSRGVDSHWSTDTS